MPTTPPFCIFVLGAESAGTRLAARILLAAGVAGSAEHDQPFDAALPPAAGPILWRRSYPHALQWPDLPDLAAQARAAGYLPAALVIMREGIACARSQVRVGHVLTIEDATANIQRAHIAIYSGILRADMACSTVSYEALVLHPIPTILGLYNAFDLTPPARLPDIYDGNARHYED